MVTSIDREGTGQGFDLELTRSIADAVSVPVIAGGGAGAAAHVVQVVGEGRADAVCLASILHYRYVRECQYDAGQYEGEGNVESLRKGARNTKIKDASLPEIKAALLAAKVPCRPVEAA